MDDISFWHSYGLDSPPFEDSANSVLYCPLLQWREALEMLHRLVDSGEANAPSNFSQLVLVVGAFGTGKSVLLSQFLKQIDKSLQCCVIKGNPSTNMLELGLALATRFKLDGTIDELRNANTELQLNLLIQSFATQQQKCLLVIDDAHRLPTETLTALLRLAYFQSKNKRHHLPIVLAGDLKLKGRLSGLNGAMPQIQTCELLPLDEKNTQAYLDCRLQSVGWIGNSPFDESAVTRIHRLSGGVPGRINRVAEQVLLHCLAERQSTQHVTEKSDGPAETIGQPYTLPPRFSTRLRSRHANALSPLNKIYKTHHATLQTFCLNLFEQHKVKLLSLSMLLIMFLTFSSLKKAALPLTTSLNSTLFSTTDSLQVDPFMPSPYPIYNAPAMPAAKLTQLPDLTQKRKAHPSKRILKQATAPHHHQMNKGERTLLNMEGYAVQLMAMPERAPLIAFLKDHALYTDYKEAINDPIEPSPHIFRGLSHQQAIYAIIYGPFQTRQEAQAWLNDQVAEIKALRPWIRSVKSVQQSLRQRIYS